MSEILMTEKTVGIAGGLIGFLSLLAILLLAFPARGADVSLPSGTQDNLQAAINQAGSGGTVTFQAGSGITFSNIASTLSVSQSGLTLRGGGASDYDNRFSGLASSLFNQAKAGNLAALPGLTGGYILGAGSTAGGLPSVTANAGGRIYTSFSHDYFFNSQKWLTVNATGSGGLSLENLRFANATVSYQDSRIVNGLIGNINTTTTASSLGGLRGNAFTNLSVTLTGTVATQYLAGGGLVGLRSIENSATIDSVSGNFFNQIQITTTGSGTQSAYLEGGGLIGVDAVSSPADMAGTARISNLSGNLFTGIQVNSGDIVLGGGLVGLNNNSQHASSNPQANQQTLSWLGTATGNVFGNGNNADIRVNTGYSLRGGGVIGLNSLSNAGARLDALNDNVFNGIDVQVGTAGSYLKGGGVVGLSTNYVNTADPSNAHLNDKNNLIGLDNNPGATNDADKFKNAAIGTAAARPMASFSGASGNLFHNIQVSTGTYLEGGGIIGVRGNGGAANLDNLSGNIFRNLSVDTGQVTSSDGHLRGGGIVGISSAVYASLGSGNDGVRDNVFDDLRVTVTGELKGGGILGVQSQNNPLSTPLAALNNVRNNRFGSAIAVRANALQGGGIIGVQSDNANAYNGIGTIQGNDFNGFTVDVTGALEGGGTVGVHNASGGIANIATLADNTFTGLNIRANSIRGGGVVGANSGGGASASITNITNNLFRGITVTSNTWIDGGGIIGVTGEDVANPGAGISHISSSQFTGNHIYANSGLMMGGLVYSYGLVGGLVIENSQFLDNDLHATGRVYGAVAVDTGSRGSGLSNLDDNKLTLRATAGQTTIFRNNTIADSLGARTNSIYFGSISNVTGSPDPSEVDATLEIDAQTGGVVALYDPIRVYQDNGTFFDMSVQGNGGDFLWGGANLVETPGAPSGFSHFFLRPGSRTTLLKDFSLTAETHDFTLYNGARLNITGNNLLRVNKFNEYAALMPVYGGTMHFNLNGTTVNDPSTVLLRIESANAPDHYVDLTGTTISLGDIAGNTRLVPGDEFYLIQTQADDAIDNQPLNGHASARQGLLTRYDFIVDQQPPNNGLSQNNPWLVARLRRAGPAREARTLLEGRATSLALLGQWPHWLADHSYQSASLGFDPNLGGRASSPIGGVDVTRIRLKTGGDIDVLGLTFMAGLATRNLDGDKANLIAAFLEGGSADYDTHNRFSGSSIRGNGLVRYFGLGLMGRRELENGVRMEGSLRAGRVETSFHSSDYLNGSGVAASYRLHAPYVAAHLGLAKTLKLDERKSLDFLARYYWARQSGANVRLSSGETLNFQADQSSRLRLGGRFTYQKNKRDAWYAGAAWEYEMDGRTRGKSDELGHRFDSPNLGGSTGVFDIGHLTQAAPGHPFSIEFGLQAYVGRIQGVSGGGRLGYTW